MEARRGGKLKWIVALIVSASFLTWLISGGFPPTEKQVSGIYDGSQAGCSEVVELTSDHHFRQTIKTPDGRTLEFTGTWNLRNRALTLSRYISVIREIAGGSIDQPKETSQILFTVHRGMLVVDWDSGFHKLTQQPE